MAADNSTPEGRERRERSRAGRVRLPQAARRARRGRRVKHSCPPRVTPRPRTAVLRDVAFRETWRYTVQGLALLPVFIAVIRHPDWFPFRFLNWPWVRHLGVLSYAFYLVHSLVLALLKTHLPVSKLWQGIIAFVLSLVVATLMHHVIEKPCARLKKRFAAR